MPRGRRVGQATPLGAQQTEPGTVEVFLSLDGASG